MRSLLLGLGAVIALILGALFVVPIFVDWNAYRGAFEKEVTAMLGREARVGGGTQLRLLPVPYLRFENVRVADVTGRFDRPLVRMDQFTVYLSVAPLLRGKLEAKEVELVAPEVRLAVDAEGKGNWAGLGTGEADLPFLPADVSLQLVKIVGGRFTFAAAGGKDLVVLEKIDGELTASSMSGPYRFKGALTHAGERREVKIATGAIEAADAIRVKAVVQSPVSMNSYGFDGSIAGLERAPTLSGVLDAQLRYHPHGGEAGSDTTATVEVKGDVEADTERAKVANLAINFESAGRPQSITGEALAVWGDDAAVEATLASRWLDLDRIAGSDGAAGPLPGIGFLVDLVKLGSIPGASVRIAAGVDQAQLGGTPVTGLQLVVRAENGAIDISSLSARLPGATDLTLSGRVASTDAGLAFTGPIKLHGFNVARLVGWAAPTVTLGDAREMSPFLLSADAGLASGSLTMENVRGELRGTVVTGRLAYRQGAADDIALVLASDRLDLTELPGVAGGLAQLLPFELLLPAGTTEEAGGGRLAERVAAANVRLDVRLGELVTADGLLRDVVVDAAKTGGKITVNALAGVTEQGLAIEGEGEAAVPAGAAAGRFQFRVDAPNRTATDQLAAVVQPLAPWLDLGTLTTRVVPLRLSALASLGKRGAGSFDVSAAGLAATSDVRIALKGDNALVGADDSHFDLWLDAANDDGAVLLRQLLGRTAAGANAVSPPSAPGKLSLRASGTRKQGLASIVSLSSPGLEADYEGKLALEGDRIAIDGRLAAEADQPARLLELIDATTTVAPVELADPTADAAAASLAFGIKGTTQRLELDDIDFTAGGANFKGRASVEAGDSVRTVRLDGDADRLTLAALLSPILGKAPAISAVVEAASEDAAAQVAALAPTWPDAAFDFGRLAGLDVTFDIAADKVDLGAGLAVDDARLAMSIGSTGVRLERLAGKALGGDVSLAGTLERQTAGAELSLSAEITGANLDGLAVDPAGRPWLTGALSGKLAVGGRGLGPRGLMSVLTGSGEFVTGEGELSGWSPVTVDTAARAMLSSDDKIGLPLLKQRLAEARRLGGFKLAAQSPKLTVGNGEIRLDPVSADASESSLNVAVALDLDELTVSAEAKLVPKPLDATRAPLPEVTFSFRGPLAQAAALTPEIDAGALERELLARRLIGGEEVLQGLWPDPPPLQEGRLEDALVPPDSEVLALPDEATAIAAPSVVLPSVAPAKSTRPATVLRRKLKRKTKTVDNTRNQFGQIER